MNVETKKSASKDKVSVEGPTCNGLPGKLLVSEENLNVLVSFAHSHHKNIEERRRV